MIWGISLILLSIIAVPSLLLSKKPNADELLAKIEPYQGWIGLVFCFWGLWGIISSIINLNWLSSAPIWWFTFLVGNLIAASLGFLLGSSLINKLILSNSNAAEVKAAELRTKLAPAQGKIGLVGIFVGAWMIIASFLFV
ncbi:MAG: hypothetical protein CML04_10225 [Pseudozobellia sp.]|nr:hypothetical protein [Pseudozobellia sp.]MBG47116.1 hypothetical protein [Pseudozobellia sp.]|tara:strand:- start:342 stop:761 length:420 start_codon:yes stop_codon:yes gene_type:complete